MTEQIQKQLTAEQVAKLKFYQGNVLHAESQLIHAESELQSFLMANDLLEFDDSVEE
ncbi:TPA: hypothetical protein M2Q89_000714 [Escherichia coli]|nr:hypothetical protein [Escherichia coli]